MANITHNTSHRTVSPQTWAKMQKESGWPGTEHVYQEETGQYFGSGHPARFDEANSFHSETELRIVDADRNEVNLIITPEK